VWRRHREWVEEGRMEKLTGLLAGDWGGGREGEKVDRGDGGD